MKLIASLLSVLIVSFAGKTQKDFNHYKTLQSQGEIPKDFTMLTSEKLENDLKNKKTELSTAEEKIFFEGTNYAIDEMLHSGIVVYGDEISTYASDIVDHLLKDDPDLRNQLRVYTIKSNATNAFSTDQGIIFVTTGLIAQVSNEAQLAFVLAHEISHFKKKHVIETFDWKKKNARYSDRINRLSQYSKEKEHDADKGGIEIYNKAGYSKFSIFETFDVLMYSYLPFDEIEFPITYFNNDKIFVPTYLFPKKKYEIKAEEDYDDSKSSHPNIKKRKEVVEEVIGEYANWGDAFFILDEARFKHVRNIARFENVRSDVIEANYGDAIYSIFLLEREFPESTFLKHMKAQVWLNLMMYKEENKSNRTIENLSDLEGESASVHHLLKKLTKDGMTTMALRIVYDLQKEYPEDDEFKAIYDKMITELSEISSFKLENYSKMTFNDAAEEFKKKAADTTSTESNQSNEDKGNSKYDRIKKQRSADNAENFDSTKFYLYALTDLINDQDFIDRFNPLKEKIKEKEEREKELYEMSMRERDKIKKKEQENAIRKGIEEVIVVEPKVISYNRQGVDAVKSEAIEGIYTEAINETAKDLGMTTYGIDRRSLSSKGTAGFNERNTLISLLNQVAQDEDFKVFPVDFSDLKEIQNNYGTSKVMFTLVEHQRSVDINWWTVGGSVIIYPTLPFVLAMYIPIKIFKANHMEMNVILLDLNKGSVEAGFSQYYDEPVHKHNLGAHMYNVLYHLNSKPL